MKDPNDEIVLDFSKFMKRFQEIEAQKGQVVVGQPPAEGEETPQVSYVKKYEEHWANRVHIGRSKR